MDKKSLAMLEFVAANSPCPLTKLEKEFAMEYLICPHYDRITRSNLVKAVDAPNGDLNLTLTPAGEELLEEVAERRKRLWEERFWKAVSAIALIKAFLPDIAPYLQGFTHLFF